MQSMAHSCSELVQGESALQKAAGSAASSPATSGTSPSGPAAAGADAADARPPVSEAQLREAWKLLDWTVALYLCTSLVYLASLRSILPSVCAGLAAAVAITHLWWRQPQRGEEGLSAALWWAAVAIGYCTPTTQSLGATIWAQIM